MITAEDVRTIASTCNGAWSAATQWPIDWLA